MITSRITEPAGRQLVAVRPGVRGGAAPPPAVEEAVAAYGQRPTAAAGAGSRGPVMVAVVAVGATAGPESVWPTT